MPCARGLVQRRTFNVETTAMNHYLANNQACSLSRNIHVVSNCFITFAYRDEMIPSIQRVRKDSV